MLVPLEQPPSTPPATSTPPHILPQVSGVQDSSAFAKGERIPPHVCGIADSCLLWMNSPAHAVKTSSALLFRPGLSLKSGVITFLFDECLHRISTLGKLDPNLTHFEQNSLVFDGRRVSGESQAFACECAKIDFVTHEPTHSLVLSGHIAFGQLVRIKVVKAGSGFDRKLSCKVLATCGAFQAGGGSSRGPSRKYSKFAKR